MRKGSGVYYLNPNYFFKGSELARQQTIQVLFKFDIKDANNVSDLD